MAMPKACPNMILAVEWNITPTYMSYDGGHGGRVVTISHPNSEAGVQSPSWPQVGKLVVACRWSAVYSTEP